MVTIDGTKVQDVKDHFSEMAKREIAQAINDPDTDELKDDDIEAIHNKFKYLANQKITQMISMNPEKLFKLGLAHESNGWREGYTKPLIKTRTAPRRAKKKIARKSKQVNRRK